jgi:hypothetical protein
MVLAHGTYSPRVDMSLQCDILSWFGAHKSLTLLLSAACLEEKTQIPILLSLVLSDWGSNPRSTGLQTNHTSPKLFYIHSTLETGGPSENHRPVKSHWLYHLIYTSPWSRFELTTLVVIGTDCIGSCKSNYHTITTTTAPLNWFGMMCPSEETCLL